MDIKSQVVKTYFIVREKSKDVATKFLVKSKEISKSKAFVKTISVSLKSLKIVAFILLLYIVFVYAAPLFQELSFSMVRSEKKLISVEEKMLKRKMKQLETSNKQLARKLDQKTPQQPYFVVNSTGNKFKLYKGKKLIREGACSTGSYIMLKAADERKWIFQTPRGVFRIQGKTTYPVWIKPDWAFIEEGLPVPSPTSNLRYEYGVLGDYALSLGHGYLIHGTLYQRFLGLPVTHGCIRLGDDDLKEVYRSLSISSKVFIF